ncbi:hypothetical protein GW17_00057108, partial [Ensete ventricosum]
AVPIGAVPTEAPPSGTAPARKGGDYRHSAYRNCHPRGNDSHPPTWVAAPAAKGAARGQGGRQRGDDDDRWMRAKEES